MQNLINQTENAKAQIKNIFDAERIEIKALESESSQQSCELRDKIHALESKKYKLEQEYKNKIEGLKKNNLETVAPLREICKSHDRVIELLDISKQPAKDLTLKANNRGKELIQLDNPASNKYINVYVYVYENKKPKNKFSLAIAASSIFTSEMLGYRWGSIEPYFEGNHNRAFEFDVKDAPTKKELIEFYNKKGAANLWKLAEFEALVKEYETVLVECNTPAWDREYLLSKKYYYENNYSRGTEQPEYKAILKQLKKFNQSVTA